MGAFSAAELLGQKLREAEQERDALRAQVAMLREALVEEGVCPTCEGTGVMGDSCASCDAFGWVNKDCGDCHGKGQWEEKCAQCDGRGRWFRRDSARAALAATEADATAWLERQRKQAVADKLEKLHAGLIRACAQSLDMGFQHGMRVAAATAYNDAAQLREEAERG